MTKRLNAKKKFSRKLGVNLWGKDNDSFTKRNYRPGQHGSAFSVKHTDYGNQLRAKQKMRFYYGNISEKQFRNTFKYASTLKGDVSENFIALLESRLDAVIYRSNIVPTVFAARQFVSHKHVNVNGQCVNIASYRVKVGDIIEVKQKSKELALVIESTSKMERDVPGYLHFDKSNLSVKIVSVPKFSEVPYPCEMEPHLITEFYSR